MRSGEGSEARLLAAVMWRRQDRVSLEHCRLWRDADSYRYESRGGSFTAHLTVDEHGVVVSYGDLWSRVAAT